MLPLIDIPSRCLLSLARHFENNGRTSRRRLTFIIGPSEERDMRVPTGTTSYHDTGSPKVHTRSYPRPAHARDKDRKVTKSGKYFKLFCVTDENFSRRERGEVGMGECRIRAVHLTLSECSMNVEGFEFGLVV